MSESTGIDLHLRIADLVRQAQYSRDGLTQALHQLTAAATEIVPGVQYADITRVGKGHQLSVASFAGQYGELPAQVMTRFTSSPCVDASNGRQVVVSPDLEAEERWPAYCAEILETTPLRTVLSLPLQNHAYVLGVLNLYAQTPGTLDDRTLALARPYASHAATAWESLRREEQFASALASRDTIGQAKGILMERFDVDSQGAFEILRQISQESNTPLAAVAQNMVRDQASASATGANRVARAEYIATLRSWRPPAEGGSPAARSRTPDRALHQG